jgi:hypothetical protein
MSSNSGLRLVDDDGPNTGPRPIQYRVLLSATLVTTTSERTVKLRTLSLTSAQIEGTNLPGQGTDVILKRGTLEVFATVAWSEGRRCALHFETAISEEEAWSQIRQPRATAAPADAADQRRPGFHGQILTEADRRSVAEWANPVGRLAYRD